MKDNEIKFIRKTLAKNLLRLRKFKGVSQQQLINQIGEEKISLRTYKDYETGNSNKLPQLDKIIELSRYFECSINFLLYNQQVTLDNDVSLYDNLKRLNRLVYCLDLIPHKIEDKNSKLYNQYYFMCFDKDIQFHIENLWNYTKRINFSFDNYNENVKLNPEMFDCVIKEGKIKNSDHSLTKQNLDKKNKYVIKLLTTKKDYKNEVEKEINKNYK